MEKKKGKKPEKLIQEIQHKNIRKNRYLPKYIAKKNSLFTCKSSGTRMDPDVSNATQEFGRQWSNAFKIPKEN